MPDIVAAAFHGVVQSMTVNQLITAKCCLVHGIILEVYHSN